MLSWLLDLEDVERAMKKEVITEEFVRIKDVCPALGDFSVKELRHSFDEDAWHLVQEAIDSCKKNPVHHCVICNIEIDDDTEASIA